MRAPTVASDAVARIADFDALPDERLGPSPDSPDCEGIGCALAAHVHKSLQKSPRGLRDSTWWHDETRRSGSGHPGPIPERSAYSSMRRGREGWNRLRGTETRLIATSVLASPMNDRSARLLWLLFLGLMLALQLMDAPMAEVRIPRARAETRAPLKPSSRIDHGLN